jgi:ATP-dependent 26S proteasome regulatory subunit
MIFQSVPLPVPDASLRKDAWTHYLTSLDAEDPKSWAAALSGQFRLSPGQIRDALQHARTRRLMEHSESKITCAELFAACRRQSNQKLHEMARKIACRSGWEDLILPDAQLVQLKEICSQVQHRAKVFGDWGFDRKLSYGKGLSVLFSGPPGTGKTLAAEVIAHALGLDCYKMDLAGLVSKYIGETEKNLSRVFQEAETSNAILFFDEADALFGKRTEVSDAHDRYANIETSFLLQKMEEYEGVVILATNLRDNMDEAFTRRIRFIVEFPFPEAEHRMAIWKRHFPAEAPVDNEIDYDFLSRKVQVPGGSIRNIVLNAAFLAAGNGQVINMEHLIQSTKREYEKIGKLWDEARWDPMRSKVR